ncbi:MAG: hypothetical protein FJ087_21605 [Deltaproteobacteria bacterium]|nr:hypothetical protein [Deltaproteobacteria bacterium]
MKSRNRSWFRGMQQLDLRGVADEVARARDAVLAGIGECGDAAQAEGGGSTRCDGLRQAAGAPNGVEARLRGAADGGNKPIRPPAAAGLGDAEGCGCDRRQASSGDDA